MEQYLRIGVITKPHGLRGEVKVYPTTDSPERFKELKEVVLKMPRGDMETEIEGVKIFKGLAVVKFKAFERVEDVQGLHGTEVYIDRRYGQPLEEGEYYIADLIGCKVLADEDLSRYEGLALSGNALGTVKDVLQTGANDVYVVDTGVKDPKSKKDSAGNSTRNIEVLLPVIPQCIKAVDIEAGEIQVHILEGLI